MYQINKTADQKQWLHVSWGQNTKASSGISPQHTFEIISARLVKTKSPLHACIVLYWKSHSSAPEPQIVLSESIQLIQLQGLPFRQCRNLKL